MLRWVNLVSGTPIAADFASTSGAGSPICIDTTSGKCYYLKAGVITLCSGLPYLDNSVNWGTGAVQLPPTIGSFTLGDQATQAATTLFCSLSGAPNHLGGLEMDLCDNGTGIVPGSAYFGVALTANMRIPFNVVGTITGWEFNATPYVGNDALTVQNIQTKTAGYTEAAVTGLQVRICTLAGGFTVVLPTAVGNHARFTFVKGLAAGVITIDGAGTETINGALTATLNAQYDKLTIVSDNANWWAV